MILPFEWTILTIEDARKFLDFIEASTATKAYPKRNYKAIERAGMLEIYNDLREFIERHNHYENELRGFDSSEYQRSPDLY